jgi:glutathione peroxidase-family protein
MSTGGVMPAILASIVAITRNFEKFLVASDGTVVAGFGPQVEPDEARLVGAVEGLLG